MTPLDSFPPVESLSVLLGSAVSVTALIGFFTTRAAHVRALIDQVVGQSSAAEAASREALASLLRDADNKLSIEVEALKRDIFRRQDAEHMETRISDGMKALSAKVDLQGDRVSQLLSLDGSMKATAEQMRDVKETIRDMMRMFGAQRAAASDRDPH